MTPSQHYQQTGAFAQINHFMGTHVECIYFAEHQITYDLSFITATRVCEVTLRCGCGTSAVLGVSQSTGHEIASRNRAQGIPMHEHYTGIGAGSTLIES